ncbi:alkaline phosphatase family protein [Pseudoalteromonas tunicata]|uniref:alkaline phosphatase family protein n=1 Tax=Pseudoalteromonas tunicata TaxID=314281 RepID=UPI00273F408D|nr:alkaline phosphatase family protein [Pseudoalteromonas tunicata]MDP4982100.1 alkaline phosphatase family protein [Pseudoalteromonas tunicata]
MLKHLIWISALLAISKVHAEKNVIVITLDGVRWQEVFKGADATLMNNKDFVQDIDKTTAQYWDENLTVRREKLMPFFWQYVAKQGVMLGNRDNGSYMSIANNWHFSYPGYSEIFTGIVDDSINSNKKIQNPNQTYLEWLNAKAKYQHKVALFGGWDVFPYIINSERSGVYVNAGFMPETQVTTPEITLLNQLQTEIPSPWHNVRLDSFTYRFAKAYLLDKQPKTMVISLGETDDFAHDGHYDQYLDAAKRSDAFIADLWQTLQNHPHYKDNTVLIVTTDHGRGSHASDWQHHASKTAVQGYMKDLKHFENGIEGSEHIWLVALGLDGVSAGEKTTKVELKQKQIAATVLTLLGEDPAQFNPNMGSVINEMLVQDK